MREKKLIDILNDENYISMKEIMETLKVSDRTIRSEIKELNEDGEKYCFKIINTRNKGYKIIVEDKEKFSKYLDNLEKISEYGSSIQKEERIVKITKLILDANNFITIDGIAETLKYSRSTIISDLEEVYKRIEKLGIKVEKKSRFGIRVASDEVKIRKKLVDDMYKDKNNIYEIEGDNIFFKVKEIFVKQIISEKINISNISMENIFYHFNILINRIKSKKFIQSDIALNLEEESKDSYKIFIDISEKILMKIQEELQIEIPSTEKDFLASQIFYKSKVFIKDSEIKEKVKADILELISHIDEENGTNFLKDDNLLNNLLMHLCALINRAKNNAQLKNPYFEEVNSRYQDVMRVTLGFINEFSKRWNINLINDEIAFVAIHFKTHFERLKLESLKSDKKIGILCSSEGGMSFLLKINLERSFGDFNIDILKYTDDIENYDFLITNIEIKNQRKGIIKIENIFEEKEIKEIINKIENEIKKDREEKEGLEVVYFKRLKKCTEENYMQFLEEEAETFTEEDLVYENFKEEVILREQSLSTAYKNGIAAPHSINMNGKKNALSITIFEEELLWDKRKVNIVFFISVKKGNMVLHKNIGKIIFKIIKEDEFRKKILECRDIKEVRNLLNI